MNLNSSVVALPAGSVRQVPKPWGQFMSKCVEVDLDQIIAGRMLGSPIHDMRGVLLLAAGTVFTQVHREQLAARGAMRVVMDEIDAANHTVPDAYAPTEEELFRLDEKLRERLDSLIRSGVLNGTGGGPALLNSVVRHGAKRCDPATKRQLCERHSAGTKNVDDFTKAAAAGRKPDARQIGKVADACLDSLVADIDGALRLTGMKNIDPSLAEHAVNVSLLGLAIGIDVGLDSSNLRTIGLSGLVQDLGMTMIPEPIRNARRRLTRDELDEIQRHPVHTANLLEQIKGMPPLVQLVAYQVHERPDGSGYPCGRLKASIHPFARILHVADAYLAMTAVRPFRPPLMPYAAMECLLRQAEKNQVDADAVRSLLRVMSLFPIGSYVRLSDGSVARVVRSNAHSFIRPIVLLVEDCAGKPVDPSDDAALVNLSGALLTVHQALPTPGTNQIPLSPEIADWAIRVARYLPEEERRSVKAAPHKPRLVGAS